MAERDHLAQMLSRGKGNFVFWNGMVAFGLILGGLLWAGVAYLLPDYFYSMLPVTGFRLGLWIMGLGMVGGIDVGLSTWKWMESRYQELEE